MFSLQLLGGVWLRDEHGPITGPPAQRHRLALLALLAAHREGVSRDKLAAYLWAERDSKHGRNLLKQAVHALRRAFGDDAILTAGDEVWLNTSLVRTDLTEFEEMLARGDHARAIQLYRGDFLDGFFLKNALEFERWVDRERARVADRYAAALEALAVEAEQRTEYSSAVMWWKARSAHDPFDSRVALRYARVLEASGNHAAAIHHVAMHEQLLRDELGMDPPPELQVLAARLRTEPTLGKKPPVVTAAVTGDQTVSLTPMLPDTMATVSQPHRSPAVAARVNVRRENRHARYGFAALAVTGLIYAGASVALGHRHAIAASSNSAVAPTTDHASVAPPKVLNAAVTSSRRRRTQSVAAYELYVRGTDQSLYRSDSGTRAALHFLQEAVALDSNYAAAWAQLGRAYARIGLVGTSTSERNRYYALADEAARKAVALDDSLAEAHTALASTRMASFDFVSAERELRRAIELDPGRGETYEKLAWLYLWTGRTPDALAHARRSVELDSLSTTARGQLALVLLANDRCDEALAELDRILHVRPPLLRAAAIAAQCYARKERWPEAAAVLSAQAETGEPTALAQVAYMYARGGRRAEALRIRDGLLERWRRGVIGAYALAVVDAGLGDLDQAMTWLDRSISDRSLVATGTNPAHVMLMGPLLEDLRRHPGFERLRPRLGLARKQ